MHKLTIRPRRPLKPELDRRLAAQVPAHPREAAIAYIRGQIEDGLAGLDSYDETILVLDAHQFERVWAHRALELVVGEQMVVGEGMWASRVRFRAIIDSGLRVELGLDAVDAPVMVEPLASRASSAPTAVMDAIFGVLPEPLAFRSVDISLVERAKADPDAHHPNCGMWGPCDWGAAEGTAPQDPLAHRQTLPKVESVSLDAMREAKAAYDRHGIAEQQAR